MMAKVKVTNRQLSVIIKHINESHSINENKDVLLGLSKLMGVDLSGQNKVMADKSLNKKETLVGIYNALSTEQIDDISSQLEELGMADAKEKIRGKFPMIKSNFKKYAKALDVYLEPIFYDENS